MEQEEKLRLAARLTELCPQPFPARVSPDVASSPLTELLELLQQRQQSIVAETYAEHLTGDELAALVRFYESELGRSYAKTWSIQVETMRKRFPSLAREAAKDLGLGDQEVAGALGSYST